MIDAKIISINVDDIRFPSSIKHVGADAMHNPDYVCVYVSIATDCKEYAGYGITVTLGKGNEIVVEACKFLSKLLIEKSTIEIYTDFGAFWKTIISNSEVKSMDIERGIGRLAAAAVGNALWDLWARIENKPVWKLLTDMTPEQLVSHINFQYITDFINKEEMIEMLKANEPNKEKYEAILRKEGYPTYISNISSITDTYSTIKNKFKYYVKLDFKMFKIALLPDMQHIMQRYKLIHNIIGMKKRKIMLDMNQIPLDRNIEKIKSLLTCIIEKYKPFWIEKALHSDDVTTHNLMRSYFESKFKLAGGEMSGNRIEIKQILQTKIFDYLQLNIARLGGINDVLAAYFMAKKANTPICLYTNGLGLCEMAQHLQMWDFICLSQSTENHVIQFIDHKHGYFVNPVHIINGNYMPPTLPGYSTMLKKKTIERWSYPLGTRWKHLFSIGFPEYFQKIEKKRKKKNRNVINNQKSKPKNKEKNKLEKRKKNIK